MTAKVFHTRLSALGILIGAVILLGMVTSKATLPPNERIDKKMAYHGPYQVTMQGTMACLPYKGNRAANQCTFGLQAPDGQYYGLDPKLLQADAVTQYPVGTPIMINGMLSYAETLTSAVWEDYDVKGVVVLSSIVER